MATSLCVHHVKDVTYKQQTLLPEDSAPIRLMRIYATDDSGETNEITFFLTDDCQIEEVLT